MFEPLFELLVLFLVQAPSHHCVLQGLGGYRLRVLAMLRLLMNLRLLGLKITRLYVLFAGAN